MKLYPLKFKPIFKERLCDGQQLYDFFGKNLSANAGRSC
jgi:hypothetical protein